MRGAEEGETIGGRSRKGMMSADWMVGGGAVKHVGQRSPSLTDGSLMDVAEVHPVEKFARKIHFAIKIVFTSILNILISHFLYHFMGDDSWGLVSRERCKWSLFRRVLGTDC